MVGRWCWWLCVCSGVAVVAANDKNDNHEAKAQAKPPHIIMIVADDMGWNDASFHGSDQIPTPNIDALAFNGLTLQSHYVAALCSPSRAALLTGKLPIHTGMQHLVILEAEPRGLPLTEKLLPEYLREAGYATHAVGKWHQGFHRREYTPTRRGFDSHFGYWNGLQDYYTHEVHSSYAAEGFRGFDMRRNMSVARDTRGRYSTDLFTEEAVRLIDNHRTAAQDRPMFLYLAHLAPHSGNAPQPLQAPDDELAKFAYIRDPERRIYAAMVSRLDRGVGEVMQALRRASMLDNSIVLFMADNGAATMGMHYNRGSNYPLRGMKASAWEGAVRGAAAIWSPLIRKPRRVHNHLMYIADWLPTLLSAAGLLESKADELLRRNIDGLDMWASISGELGDDDASQGPRDELLINIDPIYNYSAIRRGDFKYVLGTVDNGEEWYGDSGRPEDAHLEGASPAYSAERVLASPAAVAIAATLTDKQLAEVRRARGLAALSTQLLSAEQLLALRAAASLSCGLPTNQTIACNPKHSACLFNIKDDPCEQRNLAGAQPLLLASLEQALLKYQLTALKPGNLPNDPRANPALWRDTWICWQDDEPLDSLLDYDERNEMSAERAPAPPNLSLIAVLLALAVLGIFVLVALSCRRTKRSDQQSHRRQRSQFQELPQAERHNKPSAPSKTLESFTNELRSMPSAKDLARSIE